MKVRNNQQGQQNMSNQQGYQNYNNQGYQDYNNQQNFNNQGYQNYNGQQNFNNQQGYQDYNGQQNFNNQQGYQDYNGQQNFNNQQGYQGYEQQGYVNQAYQNQQDFNNFDYSQQGYQGQQNFNNQQNYNNQNYQQQDQYYDQSNYQGFDNQQPKKKKPIFLIIILAIIIVFALMLIVKKVNSGKSGNQVGDNGSSFDSSGTSVSTSTDGVTDELGNAVASSSGNIYTDLQMALNNYNAYTLDSLIGAEYGDSYLAQEWAYVNEVPLKQQFIQKICKQVVIQGSEGEMVTVSVPDYSYVTEAVVADKDYILKLFKSSPYDEATDYTFDDDMFKLFSQWLIDTAYAGEATIPSKDITISLPLTQNISGETIIKDDSELDKALFSTDDLHNAMREFSKICVEFDGIGYETYTEKEQVHNPDYDTWFEVFIEAYEADGGRYDAATNTFVDGKFDPKKSRWEPWYVRDENNNLIYDENGKKIVNYYTVKDKDGKDLVQPEETILQDVEKKREIQIPWEEERGLPYGVIGTYYIQHEYTGKYDTVFRIGDGSIERPAGFGTPIVTYLKDINDEYRAVKVALKGYWVQKEAIDYAEAFSEKNRGFSVTSPVQLICFEYSIENLEDTDIYFSQGELTLCNRNANVSARTGTLYGFHEMGILEAHKKYVLNDWYSSTELEQKYVAWGRDFGRTYPLVFFDCLAGTGEIPSYSAYSQFTGKPTITKANENTQ